MAIKTATNNKDNFKLCRLITCIALIQINNIKLQINCIDLCLTIDLKHEILGRLLFWLSFIGIYLSIFGYV